MPSPPAKSRMPCREGRIEIQSNHEAKSWAVCDAGRFRVPPTRVFSASPSRHPPANPMKTHSATRTVAATAAIVALGLTPLASWRSEAQEPTPPPVLTRSPAMPGGRDGVPIERVRAPEMNPVRQSRPASQPPGQIAPARLEVTVFELQVPEDRIADLDAQALEAKAATAQDLAKALAEFGKTWVLYKIDQTVNLYDESIMLGTSEPMVTGSMGRNSGPSINSVTYQDTGLIVHLSAGAPLDRPPPPARELCVQVNFELSVLAESGVEISPQLKATRTRKMELRHSEVPRFAKPLVLLNVSASDSDDEAQPVAYVIRYVFSDIKR